MLIGSLLLYYFPISLFSAPMFTLPRLPCWDIGVSKLHSYFLFDTKMALHAKNMLIGILNVLKAKFIPMIPILYNEAGGERNM